MSKKIQSLILVFMSLVLVCSCGKTVNEYRSTSVDKSCYYNEKLMRDARVHNVYFGFNSAELSMKEKVALRAELGLINMLPDKACVSLIGYTDPMGKAWYNRKLSQRRVDAVKNYLDTIGYKNIRVDIKEGVGRSKLPHDCDDLSREEKIKCLSDLRRVEVIVLHQSN